MIFIIIIIQLSYNIAHYITYTALFIFLKSIKFDNIFIVIKKINSYFLSLYKNSLSL